MADKEKLFTAKDALDLTNNAWKEKEKADALKEKEQRAKKASAAVISYVEREIIPRIKKVAENIELPGKELVFTIEYYDKNVPPDNEIVEELKRRGFEARWECPRVSPRGCSVVFYISW